MLRAGRSRTHALRRTAAAGAVGAVGAQVGVLVGGRAQRWIGPLRVTVRGTLTSADGGTRVEIPPLGSATLPTHRGPLRVTVQVTDVDVAQLQSLQSLLQQSERAEATNTFAPESRRLGAELAVRTAAAALTGAALAGALAGGLAGAKRRTAAKSATVAAATAGAAVAAVAARTVTTFDRDAWKSPHLTGLLERAPLILGDLRTATERIDLYRKQLAELVRTATTVYQRVATLPGSPPDDAIRLLHISDVHLSPVAFALAAALVEQYRVDAVIDTGDLVDWGTPAETAFAGQIADLGVPYVYVKGNHDSVGIAAAVAKQPNAVVLTADGGVAEVAGVRFAGMADPRFTPDKTTGDDHAEHRVPAAAAEFADNLRAAGKTVDVLLVHSPAAARPLDGVAPLILSGDIHRRVARRHGATTLLVQGSSGGAGLRGVQENPPTPCSLSVLYLDRSTRELWGADDVTVGGLGSTEVSVVRRTAAQLLGED